MRTQPRHDHGFLYPNGLMYVGAVGQPRVQSGRMQEKSLIERALELARAGERIEQIERFLRIEGYSNVLQHLDSPTLRRQIRALGKAARGELPVTRGRPARPLATEDA